MYQLACVARGITVLAACHFAMYIGVQAQIRQDAPLATYMHCSGHCLNLVISSPVPCHRCTMCLIVTGTAAATFLSAQREVVSLR